MLKMELLYNYLKYITLLFIYAKKLKLILKNICTNKFIFVRFTRGTSQKQHKYPSVDEWIRSDGISDTKTWNVKSEFLFHENKEQSCRQKQQN